MRLRSFILVALWCASFVQPVFAEGDFSPVVQVNDRNVTGFELDQRIKFLTLLKFPGDIPTEAEKGLIEDRLRMDAAKTFGVKITDEMITSGMEEFAARANLTSDQFIEALAQGGVEPETFRDFVEAGMAWREVVRAKFAGRITVTSAELARARDADFGRGTGMQVDVSEIFLPAPSGGVRKALKLATEIAEGKMGSFAEAASKYSAANSRLHGGAVGWIPASNLPPQVAAALGKLGQGQISEPVQLDGYVGLFQLHGQRDAGDTMPAAQTIIDYATLRLAPESAEAEAARIRAVIDNCDDLYSATKDMAPENLTRAKARPGQIPAAIAAALSGLDRNETALINTGGAATLVMLCERTATLSETALTPDIPPIDPVTGTSGTLDGTPAVREGLGLGLGPTESQLQEEVANQKLNHLAEAYMAELKAMAIIRYP